MGIFSSKEEKIRDGLATARDMVNRLQNSDGDNMDPETAHMQMHNTHEAGVKACKNVLFWDSENLEAWQIRVLLNLFRYQMTGDKAYMKGTLKHLKNLTNVAPDNPGVWEFRGKIFEDLHRHEDARESYEKARELGGE